MISTAALEARAWGACADLFELPDDLAALFAAADRARAEQANLTEELGPPTAAERFVAGLDLHGAVELAEEETAELRRRHEARRQVSAARDIIARKLAGWTAANRDLLIAVARPAVTALIDEARTLADKLADYAPGYKTDAIARSGKPAQIAAWQRTRELQADLDLIVAAWTSSWKRALRTGGDMPGAHRADRVLHNAPEALRYWEHPDLVGDPLLRGEAVDRRGRLRHIPADLLRVAAEPPDAGFRLVGIDELAEAMLERRHAEREERRSGRAMFA